MLRHFLGQTWVLVTTFIVGPAILFWIFRRRARIEREAKRSAGAAPRPAATPKPAPAVVAPPQPESEGARKPLGSGFLGIKWGEPPVEGMRVLHEEGETKFLARSMEDPRIGNVHISSVAYSFQLNRLTAVVIELPMSGFELLTRQLTAEWGPPRSSPDRNKHVWADPGTGPEASQAVLEKKPDSRTARLVLSSRAAQAESRAAKAERDKSRPAG